MLGKGPFLTDYLVYHTDTLSYSALCSTLHFLLMGMEEIGMIQVKIYQN